MHFSIQPMDRIFVKGYRFLSVAKNMGKNIAKTISQDLRFKYSQKRLEQSATDALKTSSKKSNPKNSRSNW